MIDLIKSQVLTEKTNKLLQNNIYVFDVDKRVDKRIMKTLIEEIFNVKVISLNSYILPSRKSRLGKFEGFKNSYKRFFVTLSPGNTIPFFVGL